MAPDDEPKVKDLLEGRSLSEVVDATTARELERWFGLPSYEQVAEQPPDDQELEAMRERERQVTAQVDPQLLARIEHRAFRGDELVTFEATLDVCVDPDLPMIDPAIADAVAAIAEPRELERPEDLSDELKEVAPQALLRDLHRSERTFDKTLEVQEVTTEERVDASVQVREVMQASWKLEYFEQAEYRGATADLEEFRRHRRSPWPALFASMDLFYRRVTE